MSGIEERLQKYEDLLFQKGPDGKILVENGSRVLTGFGRKFYVYAGVIGHKTTPALSPEEQFDLAIALAQYELPKDA